MNRMFAACLILLACGWARAAEEGAPSEAASPDESNRPLTEIVANWRTRRSQLPTGELTWSLRDRKRSAQRPTVSQNPPDEPRGRESLQVRFNADGLRFDGKCEPAIRFGRASLPDGGGWTSNRQFYASLNSKLASYEARQARSEQYTVLVDSQRETHFWQRGSDSLFAVVRLPVGTAGPLLFYDSTESCRLSLLFALIEPLRLALRPDLLFDAESFAEKARVLDERPLVDGRRCLCIEHPAAMISTEVTCRLWVDPALDHAVVRAVFLGTDEAPLAQYDIDHTRDDAGPWLPAAVTTIQFNSFGDAYDQLRAACDSRRIGTLHSSDLLSFQPPSGAWVIDQAVGEQYEVVNDGARRKVLLAEAVEKISERKSPLARSTDERMRRYAWETLLIRLVTWPWILATLSAAYAVSKAGRMLSRRIWPTANR